MHILVTGSNGFVGRALIPVLVAHGHGVRTATRRIDQTQPTDTNGVVVSEIGGQTDWSRALAGVDCIIHLAARVHVMRESVSDPLSMFRRVNVAGTEQLATQAARVGVKRLVFLSSIKVNGEQTEGLLYRETDKPSPMDAYGISKWEAERALGRVAHESHLEVVILRPPLVYGAGVGANFRKIMSLINRGWPLPFGGVDNRRSLIFVGNLVDGIVRCLDHSAAKGQAFLIGDGEDVSTPELIRRIAGALDRPARLFSVHPKLLALAARGLGMADEFNRLTGSLQLDSSHIRQMLGWIPPYSMADGLRATADWYRGLTGH
jgi:nucleoside-diphosphate-sugar epimerase